MDIIEKNLPQLIVGLDSLDNSANYIHIEDVKENIHYFCPCCKGLIKPRAYKKDIDYQVQPHFYHETGGCSEETYIHYICKNWLFEKGCKFIVKDIEYKVDSIEIEKTLHTSFGDYRPDIIVSTSIGKVFYFEIKTTNRKSALYAPKWDELGNDVVEVDTRYFVNQKHKNDVPEFSLIYSDGECFIKSYSRADYEDTIAKRKLEWKRQDKLNYKIQWERLDWFWKYLQDYKISHETKDNLLNTFKQLDIYDMGLCWDLVFNKSQCFKELKEAIREIINVKSKYEFNQFTLQNKEKYKDILKFDSQYCIEKNGLYLSWHFSDEYSLFYHNFSNSIYIENKRWILHPNNVLKFKEIFDSHNIHISEHINNLKKVKKIVESDFSIVNTISLIKNGDIRFPYNIFAFNEKYITDPEKTINTIRKVFYDEICDYYIKKISNIKKDDVIDILNDYFDNLSIGDMLKKSYNYLFYCVKYKGFNIIKIEIDNTKITIGNRKIDYCLYKYESIKTTIYNLINSELENIDYLLCNTDFVIDMSRYSNETWKFKYNEESDCIMVTLSYLIPYLNNYKERIDVSENIQIPHNIFSNITIFQYKKVALSVLDKYIAPVMKKMLDGQIEQYNKTHLTSVAYKCSEVGHDK